MQFIISICHYDDGTVCNTYHARLGIDKHRGSGLCHVHFDIDIDGYPVLDLTEDKDLNKNSCFQGGFDMSKVIKVPTSGRTFKNNAIYCVGTGRMEK